MHLAHGAVWHSPKNLVIYEGPFQYDDSIAASLAEIFTNNRERAGEENRIYGRAATLTLWRPFTYIIDRFKNLTIARQKKRRSGFSVI